MTDIRQQYPNSLYGTGHVNAVITKIGWSETINGIINLGDRSDKINAKYFAIDNSLHIAFDIVFWMLLI